ncbi:AAA family ATPase [Acinetobacter larvae]|uniref:AAA family ATPase n=1 Tax=Acinetobacter larvae TaxID=1789224 RepID=A0A1B2LVI6_9GAMM|nr:AAA family ATPase [Acinetobacter larvae]AOA56914.1 AAA family ATPase [Acinetobacter larvae]
MTYASDRLESNLQQLAAQQSTSQQQATSSPHCASRFVFEPEAVMQFLKHRIVGQAQVLQQFEQLLYLVKADFNAPNKPLAVMLLLGSTGVGKTETVRLLSEAIHGHADAYCRIDMNTLAQEHYVAALSGAPPGYVGSKEATTLFDIEAIQGSYSKPGIVLFDELEKASQEVIRCLLNIFDNGRLTVASGVKTIDFRNCLIFMTSNVGAAILQEQWSKFLLRPQYWFRQRDGYEYHLVKQALRKRFDPEFLNRIDRTVYYNRISRHDLKNLILIEIEKLNQRLSKYNVTVQLHEAVLDYLADEYDQRYGARHVVRCIRTQIEPVIARFMLRFPDIQNISLQYRGGQVEAHENLD